jgi:hypothetical protein
MEGFCAEQDDVLISIQRILFKEMDLRVAVEADPVAIAPSPPRLEPSAKEPDSPSESEWTHPVRASVSQRPQRRNPMLEQALADLEGRLAGAV